MEYKVSSFVITNANKFEQLFAGCAKVQLEEIVPEPDEPLGETLS